MKRRAGLQFGSRKPPLLEIWRRVASELGGEVSVDKRGKAKRLHVPHGEWVIVTDIYTQSTGESSQTFTRVRALFVRSQPFTLRVTRRNPFHALGALFGYRAVPMGYNQLDRALFVRSDRRDVARSMLRGTSLGQALMRDPLKLVVTRPGRRIRKVAGDSVGKVQLLKSGKVREVAVLRGMVQTCARTLDELRRLRVAQPDPVHDVAI
jgi:hypothetical protein